MNLITKFLTMLFRGFTRKEKTKKETDEEKGERIFGYFLSVYAFLEGPERFQDKINNLFNNDKDE